MASPVVVGQPANAVPMGQALIGQGSVYGSSTYLSPTPAGFIAAAEYMDFAPCCVCCSCLVPDEMRKRMYAHVYENRVEFNHPLSPCCCLVVDERCIKDQITVFHLDRLPSRVGMCCLCVPCTCCGPPVIFEYHPFFCCLDCAPICGSQIRAAPCNCWGLKTCLCCCQPCYTHFSLPLTGIGMKNVEPFLSAWKFAVDNYSEERGVPRHQMAVFEAVNDNIFDFGAARGIRNPQIAVKLGIEPVQEPATMARP